MNELKKFLSYVVPSVLAFALSGVYAIVDGYFVGNTVGDNGITTINLVYPIVALLQALGTGIGMGGAIRFSIMRATGTEDTAEKYIRSTFTCLLAATVLVCLLFLSNINLLLMLLGAKGQIMDFGYSYLHIIVLGAIFQIFGTGIVPIIRNNNGAGYAMVVMIAGFLTNVILDYVLVWVMNRGIEGAAVATIVGQAVTMAGGIVYLIRLKMPFYRIYFKPEYIKGIFSTGISAFGVTICPNISLLLMNLFLMKYGGNQAVACYAVVSYASCIVYLVLQGVGDGSQPLISDYYGKSEHDKLKKIEKMSYITSEIISIFCFIILYVFRSEIGKIFGASNEVSILVVKYMPIILTGFIFLAISRVIASVLNATEQSTKASILIYSEVIILLLLLLVLPRLFRLTAVWWSMCIAQAMAMIFALVLRLGKSKASKKKVDLDVKF